MTIAFHGAARHVTGSKHLITLDSGRQVLLDCGLFQGMGPQTDDLNKSLGFDAAKVDFLLLSHAHIDHCGLIPLLVAQGFRGKIYGTAATKALANILLKDSVKIQAGDLRYENKHRARRGLPPLELLYDEADVDSAMQFFTTVGYRQKIEICEGVRVQFVEAGHIVGSSSVHLTITENGKTTQVAFSGDVGQYGDMLLKSPQNFPQADYILLESTYGDRLHRDQLPAEQAFLEAIVHTCVDKKGKLIIPAFSVGRTQELLYLLNNLQLAGKLPKVPVYVDSPLSAKATRIVASYEDSFNADVLDVMKVDDDPFHFEGLVYIADAEESKMLNAKIAPCIIISASGMAEAGRVKHHIANNIGHAKNTILMVGYCEPTSLGGRLKNGAKEVGIFGKRYQVLAEVDSLQSMSAHGDYEDLLRFLAQQNPAKVKKVFLVHGDYDVQQVFREKLLAKGFAGVEIPFKHQEFLL